MTPAEISSDASSVVALLSEGSVSTPEVASGMASDEVGTSDWIIELISGRSVGCVRMLVGVIRSESATKELVLASPSPILALVVSINPDTVDTPEDSSDTRLKGTSVTVGRVEPSEVT